MLVLVRHLRGCYQTLPPPFCSLPVTNTSLFSPLFSSHSVSAYHHTSKSSNTTPLLQTVTTSVFIFRGNSPYCFIFYLRTSAPAFPSVGTTTCSYIIHEICYIHYVKWKHLSNPGLNVVFYCMQFTFSVNWPFAYAAVHAWCWKKKKKLWVLVHFLVFMYFLGGYLPIVKICNLIRTSV